MAEDLERLVVQLEASLTKYERELRKASGVTDRAMRPAERRAEESRRRIEASMAAAAAKSNASLGSIGAGLRQASALLAGGLAGGMALRSLVQYTDEFRNLSNQLKVAGLDGAELTSVFNNLARSAQANFAPLGSLVTLYSRASQSAKELGASQDDLLGFTDNVAKALRVAGATPESASGALLQLSQLLGSARVQAEEFNSVNEGARPILQAVADGLAEAGGSVSKLRGLVLDGQVSNRAFFEAFMRGATQLDAKLAGTQTTVSGAFENLKTSLIQLAGQFDSGAKSTDMFVAAIGDVQTAIKDLANFIEDAQGPLNAVLRYLERIKRAIDGGAESFGKFTGLANIGPKIDRALGRRPELPGASASLEELEAQAKDLQAEITALAANPLTVDLNTARIESAKSELDELRKVIENVQAAAARGAQVRIGDVNNMPPAPAGATSGPATPAAQGAESSTVSVRQFPVGGATATKLDGLNKSFAKSLEGFIAAAKNAGHDISINSGKRSVERQAQLWAQAVAKYGSEAAARKWVAPPGKSMHNAGKAADLGYGDAAARQWAHANASSFGLSFPLANEDWHIEPAGGRSKVARTDAQKEADQRAEAVKRVTEALSLEADQIGKTAEQQELLQRLQQAGVELSSAEGQAIQAKVAALFELKAANEAAANSEEDLRRARETLADAGADATKGFIADLKAGKSAAEAFANVLDRLLTRFTDSAIDSLFSALFNTGSSGGSGGLIGPSTLNIKERHR
ncbi:tape measure protein [Methylopila henanensis]|uniref:Tape measure protein n=1 Tax=Methylopila henanensis TaxID=873516 RepID=A0ABW4K4V8_9HYPH